MPPDFIVTKYNLNKNSNFCDYFFDNYISENSKFPIRFLSYLYQMNFNAKNSYCEKYSKCKLSN